MAAPLEGGHFSISERSFRRGEASTWQGRSNGCDAARTATAASSEATRAATSAARAVRHSGQRAENKAKLTAFVT